MTSSTLRWILIASILCVSLWLVGQQFGLFADSCTRECDSIRKTLLAKVLPGWSVLCAVGLGVGLCMQWRIEVALRVAGVAAILLMVYSLAQGAFCRQCFAVNTLWIALAATELKPKVAIWASAVALVSVAMIFFSLERLPAESQVSKVAILKLRGQEASLPKDGRERLVVFLDPACPHCRSSFDDYFQERDRVLVRWLIMSSHFDLVKDIAVIAEARLASDRQSGWEFLQRWYASSASNNLGSNDVKAFIAAETKAVTPGSALEEIALDGKLAKQLGIDAVPGFAAVLQLTPSKLAAERISKKAFEYILNGNQ